MATAVGRTESDHPIRSPACCGANERCAISNHLLILCAWVFNNGVAALLDVSGEPILLPCVWSVIHRRILPGSSKNRERGFVADRCVARTVSHQCRVTAIGSSVFQAVERHAKVVRLGSIN